MTPDEIREEKERILSLIQELSLELIKLQNKCQHLERYCINYTTNEWRCLSCGEYG